MKFLNLYKKGDFSTALLADTALFSFALEGRFPWRPELTIGSSGHSHSSVSEVRVLSAGLCLSGARGNFLQ